MDIEIGDVRKQSIHEIWHSDKFAAVRSQHSKKDGFLEIKPCKNCFYPRKMQQDDVLFLGQVEKVKV